MPELSVIVPIYNVEKYLPQCLDSILAQSMTDFEIICVNDGSKDHSQEILDAYKEKDRRIKVFHRQNSGYGASMNFGLSVAAGKYIAIVESDDFIAGNMFEELLTLAANNDADIVKSDFFYYFSAKNQIRTGGKIDRLLSQKVINARRYPRILKINPSIWSAIYKRSFLQETQISFLETPGASFQDTSFAFKTLALAKRIVFTPRAYLYYRQDNENSSVHSKEKVFMICEEFNEITDFLNRHPDLKSHFNSVKLIKQYQTYMWNLSRIDEKFRDEFIEIFAETFRNFYNAGEITDAFYKKIGRKDLKLLLSDREKFKTRVNAKIERKRKKEKRRKMFSIRINLSRISIVLFGKQIIETGKNNRLERMSE